MVSFAELQPENDLPLYLQIVRYVERGIVGGTITDGEEFPSRRVLSALLGINPNTVQKACRMLEEEGILSSHSGAKSCVVVSPEILASLRARLLEDEVCTWISAMQQSGLDKAQALALIGRLWEQGGAPS